MRSKSRAAAGLLVLALAAGIADDGRTADAQPVTTETDQARDVAAGGDEQQAYDLLWQQVLEDPTNLELNFELGETAMKLELFENAAAAYERILMLAPRDLRARLQLALAYYNLQSYALAEQEFRSLLAADLTPELRASVEQYLDAIAKSQQRHILDVSAYLGLTYDSNANAGPRDAIIDTSYGPIPLGAEAQQESDLGTVLGLRYDHQWDIGEEGSYLWTSDLAFNNTFYHEDHAFNLSLMSFTTGPTYGEEEWKVRMPVTLDLITFGSEAYGQFYGINPTITWRQAPNLFMNAEAIFQGRAYTNDNDKDGSYLALQLMPRYFWGDNKYMLQWRLGYAWEEANHDFKTNDGVRTAIGFYTALSAKLTAFLQAGYQESSYDDPDATYGKTQDDERFQGLANLSASLPWWDLQTVLSFNYTRNDSNISAFDYRRKQTTFMLTKRF